MLRSKILIVDDDSALQEQLAWALKRDFDLVQCLDRERALQAAVTEVPDLVLLDLHLPPTHQLNDGLKNIGVIRRTAPEAVVIVMTGDEETETPLRAVDEICASCASSSTARWSVSASNAKMPASGGKSKTVTPSRK